MMIIGRFSTTTSSIIIVFVLTVFGVTASDKSINLANRKHAAIFVFGDSVYDPGNNNYLNVSIYLKANFPPYGETFFRYPTGRFCDGRTVPDFADNKKLNLDLLSAAMYAELPIWEPYLQPGHHDFTNGANFASAGAAVLAETNPSALNLHKQLGYLRNVTDLLKQQLGDEEAAQILRNAIYLNSFGGVDYMAFSYSTPDATESELQEYVKMVIGNLTQVTKEIYVMGGIKFAFQNVGPLGCLPEHKQSHNLSGQACVAELQGLAALHNDALSNVTKELQSQLSGFEYLIFDLFDALNDMIIQPAKYGFKVSESACCGTGYLRGSDCGRVEEYELCPDPSEYVFFDGGHPTERANVILADLLWNGESKYTWPINMKQLLELNSTRIQILSENGGIFSDE